MPRSAGAPPAGARPARAVPPSAPPDPAPSVLDVAGGAAGDADAELGISPRAARRRMLKVAYRAFRQRFRVPERLTVTEWADKYRWLPDTSANPGKYNSSRAPYQREPMDLIGNAAALGVRRVVLMWASQVGKSLVIENAIGQAIHLRPRPMICVFPKEKNAEDWSKERFQPMVRATPVLRERVPEGRGRDSENTLRYKAFPGGNLNLASAGSPAELAARSCARAYCDEVDRYRETAEGWAQDIVERRGGAIDDFVQVLTSTPGDEETSKIEPAFKAGDQRFFFVPCPHCETMQRLEFGTKTTAHGLKWTRGLPETAYYQCVNAECPVGRIEERHKASMLADGAWRATNAEGRYPSFHLNALYSPFGGTTWAIIVDKWEQAQGDRSALKAFVNTFLAETWKEPGEVIQAHTLLPRLEPFPADRLPDGVRVVTAGVDVQDNRLEVRLWGWGAGEESWLLRKDVFVGDTEGDGPWMELDGLLREESVSFDGEPIRISRMFVDAGHRAQRVYAWCRPRHRLGVYACRGVGGEGVPLLGKAAVQGEARCLAYPVGVDAAKDSFLRSALGLARAKPTPETPDPPTPRYVHLPDWCDVEELEQLTAEKFVKQLVAGRVRKEWVKLRERNEALDCRNYAYAALLSLGLIRLQALGIIGRQQHPAPPIATPTADAPLGATAGATPAPVRPTRAVPIAPAPQHGGLARPRGAGWVSRFRR